MPAWLKALFGALTSEAVMEPLILLVVGFGVRQYGKSRRNQVILDLTIDIVDYIEEHYRTWGIRGSQKMDRFLQLFSEEFKKELGRQPNEDELETARLRAEAYVQRARRMSLAAAANPRPATRRPSRVA